MNNKISIFSFILLFFSVFIFGLFDLIKVQAQQQVISPTEHGEKNNCIQFDPAKRQITISCKPGVSATTLTDIFNQLNNPGVLDDEKLSHQQQQQQQQQQQRGVWLLNASLVINKGSTLTIDNKDTSWLKILTDEKSPANAIFVHGGLNINNVKVTSWNPKTNNYAQSNGSRESGGASTALCGSNCNNALKSKLAHTGSPRPYISIEENATGSTNITNSEIAYLGYEGGYGVKSSGLHYAGGDGSVIKNNNINHLYFGFYSAGIGNVLMENNKIHDSGHYGIDPHTGTHDMIIRNNTVYNNNGTAIICSLNCYNIVYENNTIYHNNGAGIVFSRNTTHSIAKDNYIHDQTTPILLDESNNNQIYGNRILNTNTSGIALTDDSSGNKVYNNVIQNATNGIIIKNQKGENTIHDNSVSLNTIISPTRKGIDANFNVTSTNSIDRNSDQVIK